MGYLAHPKGMGFQPSEIDKMTIDDLYFWANQLNRINNELNNG